MRSTNSSISNPRSYIELLLEYIIRQEDCVFPVIAQPQHVPCLLSQNP